MFDLSEKRFEQDIESFLISQAGGYEQFSYTNPDGHRIKAFCEKSPVISGLLSVYLLLAISFCRLQAKIRPQNRVKNKKIV